MFTVKIYKDEDKGYKAYSCISYEVVKLNGHIDVLLSPNNTWDSNTRIRIRPALGIRTMVYIENMAGKTIDRFEVVGQHLVPTPTEK